MGHYRNISISGGDTSSTLNLSRRIGLISRYIDLSNKYILDCGCGSGGYIPEFLKLSNNVYGIEYREDHINSLKQKIFMPNKIICGDRQNMSIKDNLFDFIFLNEVLEHIPNDLKGLREIYRVLKSGGILAIFSPNRFYPFETHSVLIKHNSKELPIWFPFIPYFPVRLEIKLIKYSARNYFPWELKRLLEEIDFRIIDHRFIWQTFENISGKM